MSGKLAPGFRFAPPGLRASRCPGRDQLRKKSKGYRIMVEAVPIEHDPFEGDGSPPKPYAVPVDRTPIFDDDVRYGAPFDAAGQATPQSAWRNSAQPRGWPAPSAGNQPSDNASANWPGSQRPAASEASE